MNNTQIAVVFGGKNGGEYLESINKFDLATLTKTEWETFCYCICTNYDKKFIELETPLIDDEIPY